jgi:hypothetical protein
MRFSFVVSPFVGVLRFDHIGQLYSISTYNLNLY